MLHMRNECLLILSKLYFDQSSICVNSSVRRKKTVGVLVALLCAAYRLFVSN